MQGRPITVGDVPCWALRVTYVGELGWELYPSAEYGLRLWDTLVAAGRPYGLVPGGYRAIDSLRLEKGYRVWGADITSETDPYSAGLGFAVRDDKEFAGRDALPDPARRPAAAGLCLVLDDLRAVALGNEPVRTADGDVVGRVTTRWRRLRPRGVDRLRLAARRRTRRSGTAADGRRVRRRDPGDRARRPPLRPVREPHPCLTDPSVSCVRVFGAPTVAPETLHRLETLDSESAVLEGVELALDGPQLLGRALDLRAREPLAARELPVQPERQRRPAGSAGR